MAEEKKVPPEKEEALPPEVGLPPEVQSALQSVNIIDYLTRKLKEGELSIPEAIFLSDYLEKRRTPPSKEELEKVKGEKLSWQELIMIDSWLERKYGKTQQPTLTPEQIKTILKEVLTENKPKTEEETPEWAIKLQQSYQEILSRLSKEEEDKKAKEIIQQAQAPLKAEIEKRDVEIANLKQQLTTVIEQFKTMNQTAKPTTPENPLKIAKETLKDIKETAQLIGMSESTSSQTGPYYPIQGAKTGIPISGSIPAWWIFIPSVVDEVLASIEKRVDKLVGLAKPPQATEELIKIPEISPTPTPPKPEVTEIPITPVPPKVEVTPPPPPQPPEEIIKLPETTEVTVTPTPATPEPTPTKKYTCVCGETFNTSLEKARHARKCPKAKEEREKKKEKEKVEPSGN
jgi:hypothetical protein